MSDHVMPSQIIDGVIGSWARLGGKWVIRLAGVDDASEGTRLDGITVYRKSGESSVHDVIVEGSKFTPDGVVIYATPVEPEPVISEEMAEVLADLRFLASRCDGAQSDDGMGFNKFDAMFGRDLASRDSLTSRQLIAAKKMLRKYQRQLGRA